MSNFRTQQQVKNHLKSKGFESENELWDYLTTPDKMYDVYWYRLDGDTAQEKAAILWKEWEDEKQPKNDWLSLDEVKCIVASVYGYTTYTEHGEKYRNYGASEDAIIELVYETITENIDEN